MVEDKTILKDIMRGKICPYCKGATQYVDSETVYGKSYGMIYLCAPCCAWVGVHKGTNKALGRLANKELREAKKAAHAAFDPIWKNGLMKRSKAYRWLSGCLNLKKEHTHIGMFSVKTCQLVVYHCNLFLTSKNHA